MVRNATETGVLLVLAFDELLLLTVNSLGFLFLVDEVGHRKYLLSHLFGNSCIAINANQNETGQTIPIELPHLKGNRNHLLIPFLFYQRTQDSIVDLLILRTQHMRDLCPEQVEAESMHVQFAVLTTQVRVEDVVCTQDLVGVGAIQESWVFFDVLALEEMDHVMDP